MGLSPDHMELLQEYVERMRRLYGGRLKAVCVFGSVARGEEREGSDIDVLTVVDGLPADIGRRVQETSQVHLEIRESEAYRRLRAQGKPALISDILLTPEELKGHPPIMLDMVDDAVILYDEGILRAELEALRRRMEELGTRKVRTKRGHYWILKPGLKPGEVVEL